MQSGTGDNIITTGAQYAKHGPQTYLYLNLICSAPEKDEKINSQKPIYTKVENVPCPRQLDQ